MQKGVDVEADDGIGFEDNEQFQDLSLQQLHEALDLLDAADIDAYREAKRHAPDLVALESDPRRFLRVENFNPWAAARRLASYWTIRKSIFGEKSLFPLRGTKGAFTEDDLRNIKSGVFQILPNDLYGHSVLFFDETKLELHTPRGFAKRIFFFLQMLSENQLSQSKGFTLVVALDKVGRISEKPGREFATDLVEQSMPLKLNDFHLLCCRPREEWTTALEKHIPKALHFLEKCVTLRAPNVHIDETHTGILHKMLNFGFEKESLPAVAGGTWDRSEFEKWLEKYDMRLTETSFSQLTECAFSDLVKETVVHYQLKVDSVDESSSVPTDDNSAINRDLYGPLSLPDIASTAEIKTSMESRRQLDEALDLIPIEQKHAFAEAKQCVPNLIETESNPIRFLEAENYNVWAAAKRLVAYWKYRKDFFGDRAFFPMLLSDTGRTAISQEDMVFLKTTGFVTILPNDRYDRVVIYNDRDKLGSTAQHSYKHRFRAFFYGLQLASEMDASRSNGLVLITDFGFAATERPTNNKNSALVMEFLKSGALPVNLKALHVIVRSEKNRWLNTYMVPAAMKALDNFRFLSLRTLVHVGKTRDVLRSKLEPFGFTDDSLPYHCGGTWKFEVDFEQWWQLRKMSDEISFRGSRVSDKKQVRPAYQKSSKDVEEAKPSTDAKVIKKRKMDIVYARRKREKERIEIVVLQEQLRALEADNFQLRGENERFESLLLVATHAQQRSMKRKTIEARFHLMTA